MFYIAQYPVRWTTQSALHCLPPSGRPVHSETNSASLGSILAMQQLCAMAIHSHVLHCRIPVRVSHVAIGESSKELAKPNLWILAILAKSINISFS